MKHLTIILLAMVMAASCGISCKNAPADNEEVLCGGYTKQRELTEEEMTLFRQVTGTGDMVFTPLSVATQVVAGINYKFWCRFEDKEKENSGHCWITVYQPLQGEPELTAIETVK